MWPCIRSVHWTQQKLALAADYVKDGESQGIRLLCSFYDDPFVFVNLQSWYSQADFIWLPCLNSIWNWSDFKQRSCWRCEQILTDLFGTTKKDYSTYVPNLIEINWTKRLRRWCEYCQFFWVFFLNVAFWNSTRISCNESSVKFKFTLA